MYIRVVLLLACLLAASPAWANQAYCPADCLAADREGRAGNYEQALKLYAKCLRDRKLTKEQRATAYNNRGNAHYFAKQYGKALGDYNKALKKDPNNALAYFNRGMVYGAMGRMSAAIQEYDQALKLDPRFHRAYYDRGMARLFLKGAWSPEAERDFVLAVSLSSRYVGKMYRDGTRLEKRGFPEKLVDKFGGRVLKTSAMANQHLVEGVEARKQKKYGESINLFNRGLAINPYDPDAYYLRGTARYLLGQDDQAMADMDQAIAYDPRHAMAHLFRGKIWLRRGQNEKALAQINESLALNPDSPHALYSRSLVYEKMGEHEKAVADMRRHQALKPDGKTGDERLKKLPGQ
ncbi:MAG: tetratricopeptide repeat protein [Proteobacteria bacterium]|nr:tetratricopeptide repeat protein [Pseudomonadota bacterium]MBU2517170.1 tetratricopeptide repeat protein [Pseudomonadota bacterium]